MQLVHMVCSHFPDSDFPRMLLFLDKMFNPERRFLNGNFDAS